MLADLNPLHPANISRAAGFVRRLVRNDRGAASIEFGVILPVLVALFVGAFEIGIALESKSTLSQAASDGIEILSDMPPGSLDNDSPTTADGRAVARYVGTRLDREGSSWSAIAEEFTSGAGLRLVSEAGNAGRCPAPERPDLTALELQPGERLAILRTCLAADNAILSSALGANLMTETRIMPMRRPLPVSCLELAELGETQNGTYRIDPDAGGPVELMEAYCDMSAGGWTMVAAQFEANPETSWNAGAAATYDPTLDRHQSFALSAQQVPPHTETGFGLNLSATAVERLPIPYSTGNIDVSAIRGASGTVYDLYRDDRQSYPDLDPDGTRGKPGPDCQKHPDIPPCRDKTSDPETLNCLILDRINMAGFDWIFCPNFTAAQARGAGLSGTDRRSVSDAAAWTVWVR